MNRLTPWLENSSTAGRQITRRRFLGYLTAGALFSSCADDDGPSTTATQPPTTQPPTTQPPTTQPPTTAAKTTTTVEDPTTTEPLPAAPEIQVTFPSDGSVFCGGAKLTDECVTIDGPALTFQGTVSSDTAVFTGQHQAVVAEGIWSIELILATGTFPITFVARDADGTEARASVTVTYGEFISDF